MESGKNRAKTDEVSKYIFSASKSAIIDFLSGIFSITLNKDEVEITLVNSEYISHIPVFARSFPDIVLEIREHKNVLYHIEIQSGYDSTMDLRMVKYGHLIGAARSELNDDSVRVITIPHQVVIYLEENQKIRDEMVVKWILPDKKEIDYTIPVLRLYQHTSLDLKEMNLYLLLPLILVKYRKKFEKSVNKKTIDFESFNRIIEEIVQEVSCITRISDKYLHEGVIDDKTKDIILSATMEIYNQLHDTYIRDRTVKEKVEHMIESVTQQISQKKYHIGLKEGKTIGLEEGKTIGLEEGKTEAMETIAKNLIALGMEDTFIQKATGLSAEKIRLIRSGF
ncbi:MAG: hypothetical protein GXY48_15445 [Methanomicrobiales archaeon]|nr:hypothetical protein [Methanomicrobiales archaeon]